MHRDEVPINYISDHREGCVTTPTTMIILLHYRSSNQHLHFTLLFVAWLQNVSLSYHESKLILK
jgi:hypothetical protein